MRLKAPKINKHHKVLLALVFLLASSMLIAPTAFAGFSDWMGQAIGAFIGIIIYALGLVLILVINGLIIIASYQTFITAPAVVQGWVIVRDVANMFFVVVLLVIAFGTILHLKEYGDYKKWLPKLVMMAVLINFSKTICGLMIDVSQVIMLTFVNAFKDVAGGNIIDILGIKEVVTMAKGSDDLGFLAIVGAYVLGLIYMVIALVVITTMMMMLAMRLVMIWIYVVLSPLAYLLAAFPGGASYASKWWSEFTKNLIVGPVIAFFIWLSFASLQTSQNLDIVNSAKNTTSAAKSEAGTLGGGKNPVGASEASTPTVLIKFIIGIGMLLGGLKIAQEIGGAAGSLAGKGMARINKIGAFAGGAASGFALARAKWAGRTALGAGAGGINMMGKGVNKVFGNNSFGRGLEKTGNIGLSWRRDLIDANVKKKKDARKKILEKMGVSSDTASEISNTFDKSRNAQAGMNAINMAGVGATAGFGVGGVVGGAVGGVAGLGASLVARQLGKRRDKAVKKAEGNLATAQANYDNVMNNAHSSSTSRDIAQKKLNDAKARLKEVKEFKGKGVAGNLRAAFYEASDNLASYSTKYTSAAAKKISEKEEKAKKQVSSMSQDKTWMSNASPSALYSSSGQQEDDEALVRHLSGDTPEAAAARSNVKEWIENYYVSGDKHDEAVLRALAKGIAATDKKGDVDMSSMRDLINAIDTKSADIGNTVGGFRSSVIAYRNTGQIGEQGTGGVYANAFASGKQGKAVLGVDFAKLQAQGINIDASAQGAHFGAGDVSSVSGAIISQMEQEKANLAASLAGGNISQDQHDSTVKDLDAAISRLRSGDVSGLSLVNTASADFGRQSKLATAYHEQIHDDGVEDEDLTERITVELMNQKLYGRNAETGGRHVSEIAMMARDMKSQGSSNDEIMAAVSSEISRRNSAESSSRAQRVADMESGKKETEGDFVKEKSQQKNQVSDQAIDTSALQKSLEDLGKKFSNLSFDSSSSSTGSGVGSFTLQRLNETIVKGNSNIVKAIKDINVGQASTPLEADVIITKVNESLPS